MIDVQSLISGPNLGLAACAAVVTGLFRSIVPAWWTTSVGQRLLPTLPILIGVVGALLGLGDASVFGNRLVLGILAGAVAAHGYKVGRTTMLGRGLVRPQPDLSAALANRRVSRSREP